ncbi:Alpha-ketoglutarate-dependent taurine dioxygenase [Roseovarius albus]|uniref:Alpha-ketoglutarate-dependent taurine dioxygenase n=1 Tax=Roseovarius albus TaxID=1247867 RepID=A0A1X6YBS8_9RHOB|nr:TauD/TfdA family dioxygenase [Roseovarius albus]SLN16470.1 Alpha-ketoglutarate-dependent taurine dioxygenase [Roseovarius albus]
MDIAKVTPAIGAEITGVDLTARLTDMVSEGLYQALLEHQVIFLRDTDITPETHMALAASFGEIDEPHPLYPHVDGFDRIVKLENDSGAPPDTNSWHTDLTFKAQQPFASILVARVVPEVGGDTMWSSCYAAYDRLPAGMKADLDGLSAVHDMGDFRNSFDASPEALNGGMTRFGHNFRPLIVEHPVTGRKFLNYNEAFVTHIIGLTTNESNGLRVWLANHMNKPEDQIRWRWRAGDLAIWDNRCTMHYAVADYLPAYRCMNRITVVRDRREAIQMK